MEKIIKDFPYYKISSEGKIYSCFKFKTSIPCNTWREVKQIYDKSCGYMIVTLCDGKGLKKNKRVHRLLMEAFIPNPNNYPQINHIDGNKLNNSLDNLEWCTAKHNSREAIRLGLCDQRTLDQSVAIEQYSKEGIYIQSFTSLHEAERCTKVAWQNIWKVCNNLRKSAGGYWWKYKESVTTIPKGSTSKQREAVSILLG